MRERARSELGMIGMNDLSDKKNTQSTSANGRDEKIEIEIKNGRAHITRFWNGQAQESYRPNSLDGAVVDVVSIILGYQPPRYFLRLDIPSEKTPLEEQSEIFASASRNRVLRNLQEGVREIFAAVRSILLRSSRVFRS